MFDYESILRTAWVEIDGTRLRDNIRAVQRRVGSSRIIGVAKANAYGHGAKEVAQAYMDCGVDMLAVATLAEAKELRDAGVDCTIVMMGLIPEELARAAVRLNVVPLISELREAEVYSHIGSEEKRNISLMITVDTGMGRIGFSGTVRHASEKAYSFAERSAAGN